MKRFTKTFAPTLSVLVVGSALCLVAQRNVVGASPSMAGGPPIVCRPVHGTIHSVFTTQNCTSPVGLCTTGTITDSGILDGATTFIALGLAPSAGIAGMPPIEPPANLSYSGQLTFTASNGTLITHDLGVLDANHLAFTEIERPFSGTGIFANPGSSVFFISGSIVDNGNGFQGDLTGTVCASGN